MGALLSCQIADKKERAWNTFVGNLVFLFLLGVYEIYYALDRIAAVDVEAKAANMDEGMSVADYCSSFSDDGDIACNGVNPTLPEGVECIWITAGVRGPDGLCEGGIDEWPSHPIDVMMLVPISCLFLETIRNLFAWKKAGSHAVASSGA